MSHWCLLLYQILTQSSYLYLKVPPNFSCLALGIHLFVEPVITIYKKSISHTVIKYPIMTGILFCFCSVNKILLINNSDHFSWHGIYLERTTSGLDLFGSQCVMGLDLYQLFFQNDADVGSWEYPQLQNKVKRLIQGQSCEEIVLYLRMYLRVWYDEGYAEWHRREIGR